MSDDADPGAKPGFDRDAALAAMRQTHADAKNRIAAAADGCAAGGFSDAFGVYVGFSPPASLLTYALSPDDAEAVAARLSADPGVLICLAWEREDANVVAERWSAHIEAHFLDYPPGATVEVIPLKITSGWVGEDAGHVLTWTRPSRL